MSLSSNYRWLCEINLGDGWDSVFQFKAKRFEKSLKVL